MAVRAKIDPKSLPLIVPTAGLSTSRKSSRDKSVPKLAAL